MWAKSARHLTWKKNKTFRRWANANRTGLVSYLIMQSKPLLMSDDYD